MYGDQASVFCSQVGMVVDIIKCLRVATKFGKFIFHDFENAFINDVVDLIQLDFLQRHANMPVFGFFSFFVNDNLGFGVNGIFMQDAAYFAIDAVRHNNFI